MPGTFKRPLRHRATRGAALLMAMLVVSLVASLAAAALWQQTRQTDVEAAERQRIQACWILNGALDWARLILREDGLHGGPDHLAEPWALPLQEARLSTFLAQDKTSTPEDTEAGDDSAFLSGRILDLQARLNANSLVRPGQTPSPDEPSWKRLFAALNLPAAELDTLRANLLRAAAGADGTPPTPSAPLTPLGPQQVEQLTALGLSPASLQKLRPYITWLPNPEAKLNLNTASATVIQASTGLERGTVMALLERRRQTPFQTLQDVRALLNPEQALAIDETRHGVASLFFEVQGRLRLSERVVQEHSLIRRTGQDVQILWRQPLTPESMALPPESDF